MPDLAQLNLVIRSTDVEEAKRRLADLVRQGGAAEGMQRNLGKSANDLAGFYSNLSGQVQRLISLYLSWKTVQAALQAAMERQMQIAVLGNLVGDAGKALEIYQQLRVESERLGFSTNKLLDIVRFMTAVGFQAKELVPTMKVLENVAIGLGGRADELDRIVLALGQMRAKGTVMSQEMRQLAEANINAWKMLADSIGVSQSKMMELVEAGAISADAAIKVIVAGMQKQFGGVGDAVRDKIYIQLQRIKQIMTNLGADAGEWFFKVTHASEGLDEFMGKLHDIQTYFQKYSKGIDFAIKVTVVGWQEFMDSQYGKWLRQVIAALQALGAVGGEVIAQEITKGVLGARGEQIPGSRYSTPQQDAVDEIQRRYDESLSNKKQGKSTTRPTSGPSTQPYGADDPMFSTMNSLREALVSGSHQSMQDLQKMFSQMQEEATLSGSVAKGHKEASDELKVRTLALKAFLPLEDASSDAEIQFWQQIEKTHDRQEKLNLVMQRYMDLQKEISLSRFIYQMDQLNTKLREQYELVNMTKEQQEQGNMARQIRAAAQAQGVNDPTAVQDQVNRNVNLLKLTQQAEHAKKVADDMGSAFGDAFVQIASGANSVSDALKNMLNQIEKLILQSLVAEPIARTVSHGLASMPIFNSIFGNIGAAAATSGGTTVAQNAAIDAELNAIMPNALGNLFSRGNLVPFARGDVFNRPTVFSMGGNRLGMMGEKGTEAIMPITRGPDGSLGVQAHGSSGRPVNIYFSVNSPNGDSFRRSRRQMENMLRSTVSSSGLS